MRKILFVCTGNTCRSSMAEGIFNAVIGSDSSLAGKYSAFSAGIYAYDGDCASPDAVKALMDDLNIDISRHRSRQINKKMIDESFLVLTMTMNHKDSILADYPDARSKVFTLKEFVCSTSGNVPEYNFNPDIRDPYGMSARVYRSCASEIHDNIKKLVEILKLL